MDGNGVISNEAGRCKSLFLCFIGRIEHTSSSAQELRLFLELLFICVTLSCSALHVHRPGVVLSWLAMFLLVGLLIFHLWFRVPVPKVAMFSGICCAMQLGITPWLFNARATRENPSGRVVQRAGALAFLFSAVSLLFAYFLRLSWPDDFETRRFTAILMSLTVAFGIILLIRIRFRSPRRTDSPSTPD